jgi:predicted regulator of Ras-like GTPase activity (Roadblock/LC7/MglB family)
MTRHAQGNDPDSALSFIDILEEMNEEGGFIRSVLATEEGLPVAAVPDHSLDNSLSALVSLLHNVSHDILSQLEMDEISEITIRDQARYKFVCRRIKTADDSLFLAALVPPDLYYRRVTNRAMKRIQSFLK